MKNSNSKASLDIYKKNKRIFIPIDNQKYIFVIVAIIYEFSYTETKSLPIYLCFFQYDYLFLSQNERCVIHFYTCKISSKLIWHDQPIIYFTTR